MKIEIVYSWIKFCFPALLTELGSDCSKGFLKTININKNFTRKKMSFLRFLAQGKQCYLPSLIPKNSWWFWCQGKLLGQIFFIYPLLKISYDFGVKISLFHLTLWGQRGIKGRLIDLRVPVPKILSIHDSKFYAHHRKIMFFSIDTHQAQKKFSIFFVYFTFWIIQSLEINSQQKK